MSFFGGVAPGVTMELGDFTPVLLGATSNPSAVTYTTQVGRFAAFTNPDGKKLCHFMLSIVTNGITKTSLNDAIRISLPFTAAPNNGLVVVSTAQGYNAIAVQSANTFMINPSEQFLTMGQASLVGGVVNLTYALLSGIGILSNTITFRASGHYEIT